MSEDIVPVTLSDYNNTNNKTSLILAMNVKTDIISNTEEYNVCLRKMEVPINSKFMPINSTTDPFAVIIFNEYKPEDRAIPGLEYGINTFAIPGPIASVPEFLKQLNDIVFKKPSPVQLGFFDTDKDGIFTYNYNAQFANEHDMIKIYFDPKLQRLFPFEYDSADQITTCSRFKAVNDYTPSASASSRIVTAKSFTWPLFYNLKAIRIYTSLPITGHFLFSKAARTYDQKPLLADITFNSMQMYNNTNLIYQPNNFTYCSMNGMNTLRDFDLKFKYFYADGTEEDVSLDSLDYASATVSFEKKKFH